MLIYLKISFQKTMVFLGTAQYESRHRINLRMQIFFCKRIPKNANLSLSPNLVQSTLKLYMKINIIKTQTFHEIKFDLKGHCRSHKFTNLKTSYYQILFNSTFLRMIRHLKHYIVMDNFCSCLKVNFTLLGVMNKVY